MSWLVVDLLFWSLLTLGVLSSVLTGHDLQVRRRARPRAMRTPRYRIPIGVAAAVIPAHNEELVLAATLRSVLAAYHREDVFIFCDGCADATEAIARRYLPAENIAVGRVPMGKSRGLEHMLRQYILPCGYAYMTPIDADTRIEPDFLLQSLKELRYKDVACVVGQIRSRWYPNSVLSVYRTTVYLFWVTVYRELENLSGSILIASGCATTWKTRVLRDLHFDHRLSVEDINFSVQVHRRRLGRVRYARSAIVWTQDPHDLPSFRRQTQRWARGWWEVIRRYKVGTAPLTPSRRTLLRVSMPDIVALTLFLDIGLCASYTVLPLVSLFHPLRVVVFGIVLGTRADLLYIVANQALGLLVATTVVSLAIRSARPLLYSPVFFGILYLEAMILVWECVCTALHFYRPAARVSAVGAGSTWVSPERRQEV